MYICVNLDEETTILMEENEYRCLYSITRSIILTRLENLMFTYIRLRILYKTEYYLSYILP